MGRWTDCATKEPTTVGGIEATIVEGEVEATTVGLAPQTAGQDRPIVGRVMVEVTTVAQVQPTAGQAAVAITAAAAGETMSAT